MEEILQRRLVTVDEREAARRTSARQPRQCVRTFLVDVAACNDDLLDLARSQWREPHRAQARTHGIEQRAFAGRYDENDRVPGRLLKRLQERVLTRDVEGFRIIEDRKAHRCARRLQGELRHHLANLLDEHVGAIGGLLDMRDIGMNAERSTARTPSSIRRFSHHPCRARESFRWCRRRRESDIDRACSKNSRRASARIPDRVRGPAQPAICRPRADPRTDTRARGALPARARGDGRSRDGLAMRPAASDFNQLLNRLVRGRENLRGHGFIYLLRIDDFHAMRFRLRDREKAVAHAPMKIHHLAFEAIESMLLPLTRSRVRASPTSAGQSSTIVKLGTMPAVAR